MNTPGASLDHRNLRHKTSLKLRPFIPLWIGLVLGALLLTVYLAFEPQTASAWKTVKVLPGGALLVVCCIIASVVLSGLRLAPSRRWSTVSRLAAATTLGITAAGLVGIVMIPTTEKVVGAPVTTFPILPDNPEPAPLQHLVLFSNGSAVVGSGQRHVLNMLFESLASCPDARVEIKAYASSPKFADDDNDSLNLDLAVRRSKAIEAIAKNYHIKTKPEEWPTADDMKHARGFVDSQSDGSRHTLREVLNRRIDLRLFPGASCYTVKPPQ